MQDFSPPLPLYFQKFQDPHPRSLAPLRLGCQVRIRSLFFMKGLQQLSLAIIDIATLKRIYIHKFTRLHISRVDCQDQCWSQCFFHLPYVMHGLVWPAAVVNKHGIYLNIENAGLQPPLPSNFQKFQDPHPQSLASLRLGCQVRIRSLFFMKGLPNPKQLSLAAVMNVAAPKQI